MTPNADRALAYGRVVKTLDDLGPTKLLPDEQDTIRSAADALLFEEDVYEALAQVEDLAERLVDADRWTPERARALVDDVAACGPLTGAREQTQTPHRTKRAGTAGPLRAPRPATVHHRRTRRW